MTDQHPINPMNMLNGCLAPPDLPYLALEDDFLNSPLFTSRYTTFEMEASSGSASVSTDDGHVCMNDGCACGQSFARPSDLQKHLNKHARPYTCSMAGCRARPFGAKSDLKRHEREVHRAATQFYCPVASCKRHTRGFGRKENLNTHVRNMHPGDTLRDPVANQPQSPSLSQPSAIWSSANPALSAPASCTSVSSPDGSSLPSDSILQIGLLERLRQLKDQRTELQRQMNIVAEQIDAVTRTVRGLGGLATEQRTQEGEANIFDPEKLDETRPHDDLWTWK